MTAPEPVNDAALRLAVAVEQLTAPGTHRLDRSRPGANAEVLAMARELAKRHAEGASPFPTLRHGCACARQPSGKPCARRAWTLGRIERSVVR